MSHFGEIGRLCPICSLKEKHIAEPEIYFCIFYVVSLRLLYLNDSQFGSYGLTEDISVKHTFF